MAKTWFPTFCIQHRVPVRAASHGCCDDQEAGPPSESFRRSRLWASLRHRLSSGREQRLQSTGNQRIRKAFKRSPMTARKGRQVSEPSSGPWGQGANQEFGTKDLKGDFIWAKGISADVWRRWTCTIPGTCLALCRHTES